MPNGALETCCRSCENSASAQCRAGRRCTPEGVRRGALPRLPRGGAQQGLPAGRGAPPLRGARPEVQLLRQRALLLLLLRLRLLGGAGLARARGRGGGRRLRARLSGPGQRSRERRTDRGMRVRDGGVRRVLNGPAENGGSGGVRLGCPATSSS